MDSYNQFSIDDAFSGYRSGDGWTNRICRLDCAAYRTFFNRYRLCQSHSFDGGTGGFLVLLADTIARMLGDAPVGAIVSFIGVPYFIYLIRKGGRTI